MSEQRLVNQALLRMSQETGIELVATNDVHYTYAEDEKLMISFCVFRRGKSCRMKTGCAMRAASTTLSPRLKCASCFPMPCRPLKIPRGSQTGVR